MAKPVTINDKQISVWPDDIQVHTLNDDPPVFWMKFADIKDYHQQLVNQILEREKDPRYTHRMMIGGSKVADIHKWGTPESALIHQRAVEFFARAMGKEASQVKVDTCWASISREHDYLTPHSHTNSLASVVYMLQPGDKENRTFLDGRLAFVDPRIPKCCPDQEGVATEELAPDMVEGAMVWFPSYLLHFVHPYTGHAPRITLAWNFYL